MTRTSVPEDVHLFQVNYSFADGHFLPYSVGSIAAFCLTRPVLSSAYRFATPGHRRESIDEALATMTDPRVLGLSCYVWNWRWNLALAQATRQAFPSCLVVLGGPQVPDEPGAFFDDHPYVDVLVHGEGEIAFAEMLEARLDPAGVTADSPAAAFGHLHGLSLRGSDGTTVRTRTRDRLEELDRLPSPYTSGVFDAILGEAERWSASQETNRGCPYSCTFCDWGSAVFSRVRPFPAARVVDEIAWFGRAGIDIVYNCDANFGMFERDLDWAEELARSREATGFPRQFRTSYAKKSDDRVFTIAKRLLDAGLQRGVGVSLQSLDDATLAAIKRRNLRSDRFTEVMATYREAGLPTYTEVIVGLPGETLDSFKDGVGRVLDGGQHEGLLIYPCQVLPNAELAHPTYRAVHGIRTVSTPLRLGYSTLEDGDLDEFIDVVVGTATMSEDDWQDAYTFGLCVQAFHCLNLTQVAAVVLRHTLDLPYRSFYEALIEYGASRPHTLLGELVSDAGRAARKIRNGQPPGVQVEITGASVWNPEEAMFLAAVTRKPRLADEVADFLTWLLPVDGSITSSWIRDLATLQAATLVGPQEPADVVVSLQHELVTPLEAAYRGERTEPVAPTRTQVHLTSSRPTSADVGSYALDMLRYGRKDNHLRRHATVPSDPA